MPDEHALEPAAKQGPIFIVGAMGSGTTLLRLMLDSHKHIAVPPETGFMRAYNAHRFIPFKHTGRNWAWRLGWSRKELDAELAAFYDRLFRRYVETHGKRRWGEKTPLHTWHIRSIARLFPDAVFVGIVRHPAGCCASNMKRWSYSLGRAASHYDRYYHEIARQAARYPGRFVVLRYEDLIVQPEPVMRELLEWLGEPWDPSVLAHHEVQRARGGRVIVEGGSRVDDPIDVKRIGRWREQLSPAAQRRIATRLGRLGAFWGYAPDDPAVLQPVHDRGSLLIGGPDIAERMDSFADLELHKAGEPPRYELLYNPRKLVLEHVFHKEPGLEPNRRRPLPSPMRRVGRRLVAPLPLRTRRLISGQSRRLRRFLKRLR